jgi:Tol biopolymer transport system component
VNFKPELSWSPRGDRIVLTKTSSEIWIMDIEQETLTPLASEGWTYTNPVWSPDGDLIAFSTPLKGIETIRPDGSGRRLLNDDDCAGGMALAWSPSGEKIAYSSCGQVKVMNRDGSGQQTVKSDIFPFPLELCWSPTGDTIAMSDGYTVYLIALDRESSDSAALTSQNNKTSQVPGFIAVSAMFALILVGSRISVKKRAISKRSDQKPIPSQIRSEKTAIKEKGD